MKKYFEQMDYGVSGRSVFSIGPMPELRKGQSGWRDVDFSAGDIPKAMLKTVKDRGYVIVEREL
jgi:hypothetical protein